MRRRLTLLAALAVLVACSQEDQSLPFQPEPSEPVTRTMGSGNTTVSSPDGISITVPAGALPTGTSITVAKLNQSVAASVPGAVGDAFLVGFGDAPSSDPSLSFSFALSEDATAGQLVGMVPVVLRVGGSGAAPSGNLGVSKLVSRPITGGAASGMTDLEKLNALKEAGIFDSFGGDATTSEDISRSQAAMILSKLLAIADDPPASPPLFTDPDGESWYEQYLAATKSAILESSFDPAFFDLTREDISHFIELALEDPEYREAFASYLSGSNGYAFLITYVDPAVLSAYGMTEFPSNDESSYPLIPVGSSSATFTLLCTGIKWPSVDDVSVCSENNIDVRVGSELLKRYPASVFVPHYLLGEMTLGTDGSATGRVEYEVFLRSALSSGITGAGREGSFDLSGSWSARGDTITIGGHDFLYATPDDSTLILSVSDSVKIQNNDGSKSWEPVQVNVKLARK